MTPFLACLFSHNCSRRAHHGVKFLSTEQSLSVNRFQSLATIVDLLVGACHSAVRRAPGQHERADDTAARWGLRAEQRRSSLLVQTPESAPGKMLVAELELPGSSRQVDFGHAVAAVMSGNRQRTLFEKRVYNLCK